MSKPDSHQRLHGSRIISRTIRPPRVAFIVQSIKHCDFIIDVCSLTWGGKNFLIVPVDESQSLTEEWWQVLVGYDPDQVISLCDLNSVTDNRLVQFIKSQAIGGASQLTSMPIWKPFHLGSDAIHGFSLYAVLANLSAYTQDKERFIPVMVPTFEPDDPMALFIKARYGYLNETWASEILGRDNLRHELRLSDFVRLETVELLKSEDSFLNHVIWHEGLYDAQKRSTPLIDYTFINLTRNIDRLETLDNLQGPRETTIYNLAQYLLVISEEASVEDFCWYWNLRAQRYLVSSNVLPLWLPKQKVLAEKSQVQKLLNRSRGSQLTNCFLLSKTVPTPELKSIAGELGEGIKVATNNLGRFYNPTFRVGIKEEIEAFFFDGAANIPVPQIDLIRQCNHPTYYYLDIEIPRYKLPRLKLTNGESWHFLHFDYRVSKTGLSFSSPWNNRGYIRVNIPTGWELLKSFANIAGYEVEWSDKGKMSERVIQLVNGIANLWIFSGKTVYELFDELSELSQAKEFKGRLKRHANSLSAKSADDFINQILQGIASDHHQRVLKSYSDILNSLKFRKSGSQTTAEKLVRWFLDTGIIFRGTELSCPICSTKQWKFVDELGAKMRCVGCQETINTPLEVNSTNWRYRINTLFAKAHEQGIMPHLLTVNYALQELKIFQSHPFGLFPGVKFKPIEGRSNDKAEVPIKEIEVDVVWINQGLLTIAECKTRGKDLSFQEVENYIKFGQLIGCHQIVFSALDDFKDLTDETKQLIRISRVPILCLGEKELFYQHQWRRNDTESLSSDFETGLGYFFESK